MRQLVKFIRRERDILQTHHELAIQERDRFKLSNDQFIKNLDEVRSLLQEERKKNDESNGGQRASEMNEKINQINVLRESNSNLRDQHEESLKKIVQLSCSLKEAEAQLGPLRSNYS